MEKQVIFETSNRNRTRRDLLLLHTQKGTRNSALKQYNLNVLQNQLRRRRKPDCRKSHTYFTISNTRQRHHCLTGQRSAMMVNQLALLQGHHLLKKPSSLLQKCHLSPNQFCKTSGTSQPKKRRMVLLLPPPSWDPVSTPDFDMIPKKASQVVYATGSPKHNVQKAFSGGKRNKKRASPNCSKKTSPKFKKKASPKAGKPRASWNIGMEKSLVDILLEHNNTFHRGQNGWSSETWNVMVKLFLSRHPYLRMEKSQIQDKEKDLKRDYRMLKEARMQSGVGWDESQFKLQAEPHLWENLEISFGTRIKRFKTKAFPLYDSLGQLYEGSIAEGNFNFTSTSTTSREDLTQVISDDDEPEGDTEADIPERESEDEHEVMDPAPSAQSMTQVEHQVKGKRVAAARNKLPKIPKRSPKKRNSDGIVQVMERMVQVREKEVNQEQPLQKFSITRCMDALKTLDGMTGSIKIPALDVFRIADNREIFLNLVDDKDDKDGTAMTWLLGQIAKLP